MAKEATQRRVYVLPNELVERILAFQRDKGLASEVEAVRRLLDEALMQRDSATTIIQRVQEKFKTTRILSDIARDILVGHPLITDMSFDKNGVGFSVKGYGTYRIQDSGTIYEREGDRWVEWDELPF